MFICIGICVTNSPAKVSVCILLSAMGCQWLTATLSFSDLILNALALEFTVCPDMACKKLGFFVVFFGLLELGFFVAFFFGLLCLVYLVLLSYGYLDNQYMGIADNHYLFELRIRLTSPKPISVFSL